jgi:hypothetical protein
MIGILTSNCQTLLSENIRCLPCLAETHSKHSKHTMQTTPLQYSMKCGVGTPIDLMPWLFACSNAGFASASLFVKLLLPNACLDVFT